MDRYPFITYSINYILKNMNLRKSPSPPPQIEHTICLIDEKQVSRKTNRPLAVTKISIRYRSEYRIDFEGS